MAGIRSWPLNFLLLGSKSACRHISFELLLKQLLRQQTLQLLSYWSLQHAPMKGRMLLQRYWFSRCTTTRLHHQWGSQFIRRMDLTAVAPPMKRKTV